MRWVPAASRRQWTPSDARPRLGFLPCHNDQGSTEKSQLGEPTVLDQAKIKLENQNRFKFKISAIT
jgi:hypothetical protein